MKVLLSPSSIGNISNQPLKLLTSKGYDIVINPYKRKLTESEVIELAHDCVGIVAGVEEYNKRVLDKLKKLRCISRVGVGMDSIDIEYAKAKGIVVENTPDGPTQAVAELALGLTMATLRKVGQAHHNLKMGIWKKETGYLLQGKTIGVIGVGRIGRKTAEIFKALGSEVIGYDLYPNMEWALENNVRFLDVNTLLQIADVVILHLPGNLNGDPVISASELEIMKENSILVNLSRGGVVDEKKLKDALEKGKFAGVALDVFSEEPYYGELVNFEQVILTPHLGSYAKESKLKMEMDAVNNLILSLES